MKPAPDLDADIAIIGWKLRFPGAESTEEFWQNLRNGVESIHRFTDEELIAEGFSQADLDQPNFVKATPILPDVEQFDAEFFGFSPRDAEIIDPQFRIFLELSWAALEDAGYDPESFDGRIGVFGGANISRYYMHHLMPASQAGMVDGGMMTQCFNDKDALCTLVSYKLNLKGPSVNVQSFCSTSLVAVHLGCQSLRLGESEMVLAGGTNLNSRSANGYVSNEGDIVSSDGSCRTFDKDGSGTVFGSGAGIAVLKLLKDAQRDGDTIHGIIKGSTLNNDGSSKAGYTAPSVDGQREAVKQALANADVHPESISYVEAHGTATHIGDPIEVEALTQAYRTYTDKKGWCAIGSVKTNMGHLDRAAGMPSLLKVVLAAKNKVIPPNVNFQEANPEIDFPNSPFYPAGKLQAWEPKDGHPRRAGISALGFGGTNAHVIVEEAPAETQREPESPEQFQMVFLSARTETALSQIQSNLARHIQKNSDLRFDDLAWTLQVSRRAFPQRTAIVCRNKEDALDALEGSKPELTLLQADRVSGKENVVFMFSGQGSQYVNMGKDLYATETVFQAAIDQCAELLNKELEKDLRSYLYPEIGEEAIAAEALKQTAITQPTLFAVEYAMARLLASWGIEPDAMIGHSIGEYVAAHLAGVFSLEDGLKLVAARGRLMQSCKPGDMLALGIGAEDAKKCVSDTVNLAAANALDLSVLSGDAKSIAEVAEKLEVEGILARKLETSHAFHSFMMDPILEAFKAVVAGIDLNAPQKKYISNVSGTWIKAEQATDPEYYAQHLRGTVQFAPGAITVAEAQNTRFVEVGPGKTLATFTDRSRLLPGARKAVPTMRHPKDTENDAQVFHRALASLWVNGADVDAEQRPQSKRARRVSLPTYPFERTEFWVDRPEISVSAPAATQAQDKKKEQIAEWLYTPTWKPADTPPWSHELPTDGANWLLLVDKIEAHAQPVNALSTGENIPAVVYPGEVFKQIDTAAFEVPAKDPKAFEELLKALKESGRSPSKVVYAWTVLSGESEEKMNLDASFFAPLFLCQALGGSGLTTPVDVALLTDSLQQIKNEATKAPIRATVSGIAKVVGKENPMIRTRHIDVLLEPSDDWIPALFSEFKSDDGASIIAWRGKQRWLQHYAPTPNLEAADAQLMQKGGTYIITGGFGGLGKTVANHLAKHYQANIILTTRSPLPPVGTWDDYLRDNGPTDSASIKMKFVRRLEKYGAKARAASANATDVEQMKAMVAEAVAQFGSIDGVFHTAGLPGGGIAQVKERAVAEKVLRPKIEGTRVLDIALEGQNPKFVMLFSSVASVIGPFGQVDYAAANSFLDHYARYKNDRSSTFWTATNWDDWAEVGMAVETSFDLGVQNAQIAARTETLEHPLFSEVEIEGDQRTYKASIDADKDWVVYEHLLFEKPTMPGSAYLEYARAAYAHATGDASPTLRDIFILNTFPVERGTQRDLFVNIEKSDGAWSFSITSITDGVPAEHAIGKMGPLDCTGQHDIDVSHLKERLTVEQRAGYADDDFSFIRGGVHLELGPRWHNTRYMWRSEKLYLGQHRLHTSIHDDVKAFPLHPGYTDFTTLFPFAPEGAYVLFSYRAIHAFAPLQPEIFILAEVLDDLKSGNDTLRFNATFVDKDGKVLLYIDELTLRRVDNVARPETAQAQGPMTLTLEKPGILDSLKMTPVEHKALPDDFIRVEVAASGLNFRDVLRGLGMLSDDHDMGADSVGFGTECAGIITEVGGKVKQFNVGDEVLGLSTFGFSTELTIPEVAAASIPEGIGFEEASGIPLVFLTVHHGLHKLAKLQKGERVLVHAAAGGIGLAAIQYAQAVGAEIFATAGSTKKQAFLRELGVEHITTSRDLSFADDILKWTNGEGVDVVLNALAGDFLTKSMEVLRPFGRFIEIGARDIYSNTQIGLLPFSKNLTFSAFDLGQVSTRQPDYLSELLNEVMQWFEAGKYTPLPTEVFAHNEIVAAFQHMAAAKHIGKVVVAHQNKRRKLKTEATATASSVTREATQRDLSHGILSQEGMQIMEILLQSRASQVVVNTRDLEPMMQAHANMARNQSTTASTPNPASTRRMHKRPNLPTAYLAPRNATEEKLAEMWQAILSIEKIGIHDSFFELGGDSLIGVQLVSQIKAEYSDKIAISDLYDGPTIAQFADKLSDGPTEAPERATASVTPEPEKKKTRRERRKEH